ncbi:GNAT family N-acetyltransferase [Deltaproteobacteria bacterium TL4]
MNFHVKEEKTADSLGLLDQQCFDPHWNQQAYSGFLNNPHFHGWVLEEDPRIPLAFIALMHVLSEVEILRIGVLPQHRKKGVASQLLVSLENYAQNHLVEAVFLEVHEKNQAALKLYNKCGFYKIGERKDYYLHPPGKALVLRKQYNGDRVFFT